MEKHFRPVKEDVTNAPAEHDAEERGPGDEVADLLDAKLRVTLFGESAKEKKPAGEGEDVSHPVPARTDVTPEVEDERIEVVEEVSEHQARELPRFSEMRQ